MRRTFAMVSPAFLYSDEFRSLSLEAKTVILVILDHERIELTGAGAISPQIIADILKVAPEWCEDCLEELHKCELIFYDPAYGMVLIRKFWAHTTMNPKGLEHITAGLKSGEYGRTMGHCECSALIDLLEELENPSSMGASKLTASKKLAAKSLAEKRISELEQLKLCAVEDHSVNDNGLDFIGFEELPPEIKEA